MMHENLSGKTEKSFCVPQYFAWVNHGNDGSTEEQTLKNLEFFGWLKKEYGMQIEIYALDAGNFDSPMNCYYDPDHPMAKKNFPNGFSTIAAKAAELDIQLGMWCGPDGFGDTDESAQKRFEQVVALCRDSRVALLKFDLVCGELRPEKQKIFEQMVAECRKYCPELIVLNHRLDLGEAQKYATTFLWEGQETYIDVLMTNNATAPHHRQGALVRGLVPGLQRLTEDHGVCLSSCLDFFEDELVLQAFNRALILSPEIYGTPAFLRDDEFARLARIFVLSKKFQQLLTQGMELPAKYGAYAVSRGNENARIVTFRNNSWQTITLNVKLDEEIGLQQADAQKELLFVRYHPTQRVIGRFSYGQEVSVEVEPFRTYMAYIGYDALDDILLTGCDYEVIRDIPGRPVEINLVRAETVEVVNNRSFQSASLDGKPVSLSDISVHVDAYLYPPKKLGTLDPSDCPENLEELYEATCFGISNDSLERQAVSRFGATKFQAVQAVRDAFFDQLAYQIRGCDSAAMFDENPNTFFDSVSRMSPTRICGGCLRVDLKQVYQADTMEIEYFNVEEETDFIKKNELPKQGDFSCDLKNWVPFQLDKSEEVEKTEAPFPYQTVERVGYFPGGRMRASYVLHGSVRYIRLPRPMDRIYAIRFYQNGQLIHIENPAANNLMAPYAEKEPRAALSKKVRLPQLKKGSYLSLACNGEHGVEGVYCVGTCQNQILICPDRSVSYPVQHWNHWVAQSGSNYTYYMPLDESLSGQEITLYAMICKDGQDRFSTDVYLCSPNDDKHGATLILQ